MSEPPLIGYCTNVHPGESLAAVRNSLQTSVRNVRSLACPDRYLQCGLWLNEQVVAELKNSPAEVDRLEALLDGCRLQVRTLNAFPMLNFQQEVVKQAVYAPDWTAGRRLEYSEDAATLLVRLLSGSGVASGSISTLPLGWGKTREAGFVDRCIANLKAWSRLSDSLQEQSGIRIRLAIEPEPGCYLDRAVDVCEFWHRLRDDTSEVERQSLSESLGVCHDVCHSAVMFEKQPAVLQQYEEQQIPVFKVQVSAALETCFATAAEDNQEILRQLQSYVEPRFLHQTNTVHSGFHVDLPAAIEHAELAGVWRTHFHVPIFAGQIASGLGSTQQELLEFLAVVPDSLKPPAIDWEIETYAWSVLPPSLFRGSIEEGIAQEILWLAQRV